MSAETEPLLLKEVARRLRAAIPNHVPLVGADDTDELVQDGLAIALRLQESAQAAGKAVTPGNLAFYTLQHLRSGRRSTGSHRNDVLHPVALLNGHSRIQSLDEPIGEHDSGDEPLTLHDCLASPADDPSTTAARRLDWKTVLDSLDRTAKAVLTALVEGRELTLLVSRLRRSRTSLQNDKIRLGRVIRECLGEDILIQVQVRPTWTHTLDAVRERLTCRAERRLA
jgi:hypothetical protein